MVFQKFLQSEKNEISQHIWNYLVLIETLIIRLRIKKLFSSHQHFTTKAEGQKYRESSNETDTMEMQLCNMCVAPQCVSYWLALSR